MTSAHTHGVRKRNCSLVRTMLALADRTAPLMISKWYANKYGYQDGEISLNYHKGAFHTKV